MKLRLGRIFLTDFPAMACALAALLLWLFSIGASLVARPSGLDGIMLLASPLLLVATSVVCWRAFRVWRLFDLGKVVQGTVTSIAGTGIQGRVEFSYQVDGDVYRSWMPVRRNGLVMALRPRQKVGVLVGPRKPKTAIVAQLFT